MRQTDGPLTHNPFQALRETAIGQRVMEAKRRDVMERQRERQAQETRRGVCTQCYLAPCECATRRQQ